MMDNIRSLTGCSPIEMHVLCMQKVGLCRVKEIGIEIESQTASFRIFSIASNGNQRLRDGCPHPYCKSFQERKTFRFS